MTKFLVSSLLVAAITVVDSSSDTPKPTPYPNEFSIDFVTNVTETDNTNFDYSIEGKLFYSWPLQSQRIDHAAGSYECFHFYNTLHGCSLLFLPTGGMYRFLGNDCCLDRFDVRTPPPDWAARANPTFQGAVHDVYSGLETNEWAFDNITSLYHWRAVLQDGTILAVPFHTARQVAPGKPHAGSPVLFTFPGNANGRQDFHYNVNSLVVGPQDPNLFRVPDWCENVLCDEAETIPNDSAQLYYNF